MSRKILISIFFRLVVASLLGVLAWYATSNFLTPRPAFVLEFRNLTGNEDFQAAFKGQYLVITKKLEKNDALAHVELREPTSGILIGSHIVPRISEHPFVHKLPEYKPLWYWQSSTKDVVGAEEDGALKREFPNRLMEANFINGTSRVVHEFPSNHQWTISSDGSSLVEVISVPALLFSGLIPNNTFMNLFYTSLYTHGSTTERHDAKVMFDAAIFRVRSIPTLDTRFLLVLPAPASGVLAFISQNGKYLVISDSFCSHGKQTYLQILGQFADEKMLRNGLFIYDTTMRKLTHKVHNEIEFMVADYDTQGHDTVAVLHSRQQRASELDDTLKTLHLCSGKFIPNSDFESYNVWPCPWPSSTSNEISYAWYNHHNKSWIFNKVDESGTVQELGRLKWEAPAELDIVPGTTQCMIHLTQKSDWPKWLPKLKQLDEWFNPEKRCCIIFDYVRQVQVLQIELQSRNRRCSVSKDGSHFAVWNIKKINTWEYFAEVSIYQLPIEIYSVWLAVGVGFTSALTVFLMLQLFGMKSRTPKRS